MIGGKPSRARRIVLRNNGIRSRHYAIDPATGAFTHSNAHLAAEALRGLDLVNVEVLACGTSCADQLMPGHAVMVHGELGIPPARWCRLPASAPPASGALKYAYLAVLAGQAGKAVASGSERASGGLLARLYEPESAHRVAETGRQPGNRLREGFPALDAVRRRRRLPGRRPSRGPDGLSLRIDWIDILSQADSMPVCMYARRRQGRGRQFPGLAGICCQPVGRRARSLPSSRMSACSTKPSSSRLSANR